MKIYRLVMKIYRWHGHAERKGGADNVKACTRYVEEGTAPIGGPCPPPQTFGECFFLQLIYVVTFF